MHERSKACASIGQPDTQTATPLPEPEASLVEAFAGLSFAEEARSLFIIETRKRLQRTNRKVDSLTVGELRELSHAAAAKYADALARRYAVADGGSRDGEEG